jgi:hypothetical protein
MPELSQLKDIHLPAEISGWPWAMPSQIIFFVGIFLLIFTGHWGFKHYQKNRPKRIALRLLAQYQVDYTQHAHRQKTAAQISELLKRVALAYFPRKEVAGLEGQAWIDFLNRTGAKLDFNRVQAAILVLPYCLDAEAGELPALIKLAKEWILQRSHPCQN